MQKKRSELLQYLFFFFCVTLVLFMAVTLSRLSVPLVIAYVIALIVSPLITSLKKMGLKKELAIIILLSSLSLMVFLPIFKLVPLMQNEGEKLQYYLPKIESYVESTFFELKHKVKANTGLDLEEKYLYSLIGNSKDWVTNIILNIPSILGMLLEWVFIIPLFLFFLLKDGKVYRRLLLRLTPNTLFERAYYVTYQFNRKLGDYIFAKFFEATIVGGIIGIGLLILDVRFAITLGIIAAITNIIPYVGPLLGSAPAIIFGMIEYGSGTPIFYGICFLMLIANIIDMGLVFPLLVSKIVDLHPIVVVASVILGSQYWGLVGMIVSIPLAAAVKLIFIELYREIYAENIK